MNFNRTAIALEDINQIASLNYDTYCLIAPPTLAKRIGGHELSSVERARMQRFRLEAARDRFLVAHSLMRRFLGSLRMCDPADLEVTFDVGGKPIIKDRSLHFNMSYSDRWIALFVTSCGPVGVDVEYPTDLRQLSHDAEPLRFSELPFRTVMNPADRFQPTLQDSTQRFYACWTLKEAISKVDGRGLTQSFETIRLKHQGDGVYKGEDCTDIWWANHSQLADGTHMAHACKRPLQPFYVITL